MLNQRTKFITSLEKEEPPHLEIFKSPLADFEKRVMASVNVINTILRKKKIYSDYPEKLQWVKEVSGSRLFVQGFGFANTWGAKSIRVTRMNSTRKREGFSRNSPEKVTLTFEEISIPIEAVTYCVRDWSREVRNIIRYDKQEKLYKESRELEEKVTKLQKELSSQESEADRTKKAYEKYIERFERLRKFKEEKKSRKNEEQTPE